MNSAKTLQLSDNSHLPTIGLGTWKVERGRVTDSGCEAVQVELHPVLSQTRLLRFCLENGVAVT
jgi:diketogulonate reductase-like aldo/keto reductase